MAKHANNTNATGRHAASAREQAPAQRGARQTAVAPEQRSARQTAVAPVQRSARQAAMAARVPNELPDTLQQAPCAQAERGAHGRISPDGEKRRKKQKGSLLWRIVFWVALVVFVCAAGVLGYYVYSYWHQQNAYEEIAATAHDDINDVLIGNASIRWESLRAINAECVGWIYMPDTMIDYPVCHTSNDTKYLTTSFNGVYDAVTYGTIFLEAQANGDFSSQNNVLFGHNMANGGMFAKVTELSNAEQFEAHRTLYLMTPNGTCKLRTFSLVHAAATEVELLTPNFSDTSAFTAFVQDKIDRSVVRVADCPAASDITKVFALITCDSGAEDAGRWVLYCYVQESDVANWKVEGDSGVFTEAADEEAGYEDAETQDAGEGDNEDIG